LSSPLGMMDPKLVKIPQLTASRCKFDGLLQHIASRSDETIGAEEIAYEEEFTTKSDPKSIIAARNKKKETNPTSGTFMTKILDCSVDLAPFNDATPLYAMVRNWARNNAPKDESESSESEEDDPDQEMVTVMPGPIPRSEDQTRIPLPLPPTGEDFFMASQDDKVEDVGKLIGEHLLRWKTIRQKWRECSVANEGRYFESCELLARCQAEPAESPHHDWEGIEPL